MEESNNAVKKIEKANMDKVESITLQYESQLRQNEKEYKIKIMQL